MREYGTVIGPDTIQFQRVFPGPLERVWEYLTDSDRRGEWLASGPMELKVGGEMRLDFRHQNLASVAEPVPERYRDVETGAARTGRVTRCEPPRLLAYTWPGEDSEVTFELEPRGDEVLLVLTHRRLASGVVFISVAAGWHTHLGILGNRLAGRAPGAFWSVHERLAGDYARRLSDDVGARGEQP